MNDLKKGKVLGEDDIFDVRELGWGRTLVLGLQHTFAMFGATVLVPLLTGLSVSTTLLFAGLGTLLFHLITKRKVPAFLGSSFAFLAGYGIVAPLIDGAPNTEMLPYACGGVVVAGLVYVVLAALIKAFGINRVMRFFPPIVTGPIIICIGLTLSSSAIANCSENWLLALCALVPIIIANIWGKGMVKIVPIMIGIGFAYVVALLMGAVDFSAVAEADVVGLPGIMMAKFDLSAIITIVPIALATVVEHIGDISAISATVGKNYIQDPGLHRTLLGDGLATSLAAMFGGPANTTYGENTGVLALTRVYDPLVMEIAAGIAILLSFSPMFEMIVRTIPTAIIGGVSLILYGMISAVGVRNVVENQIDFTASRNLIIAAVIMVSAIGFSSTGGLTFQIGSVTITLSALAIAALAGILLNAVLPGNTYEFEKMREKGVSYKL